MRNVVTSAAEAETAALFYNAKTIIELRRILHALGHVQPPTPIKTDNSTALGFITNFVHQKRSKSWDMRFHWLKEHHNTDFSVYGEPGKNNHAGYFTKHHSPIHHKKVRNNCILKGFNIMLNKCKKGISDTDLKLACEGVLVPPYLDHSTKLHTSIMAQSQNDRWNKMKIPNSDNL